MMEQEKKQLRRKTSFFAALMMGCLSAIGLNFYIALSAYQNNQQFAKLDAEDKFYRLPEYLSNELSLHKDSDALVRSITAEILGESKEKGAITQLIILLKDFDKNVRANAAKSLGKSQAKEAIPHLIPLLKDFDKNVRANAAKALGELQAKEAIPHLIPLLKDFDKNVRANAAKALGELPDGGTS